MTEPQATNQLRAMADELTVAIEREIQQCLHRLSALDVVRDLSLAEQRRLADLVLTFTVTPRWPQQHGIQTETASPPLPEGTRVQEDREKGAPRVRAPEAQMQNTEPGAREGKRESRVTATAALSRFFMSEVRLSKRETKVRVAKIEREFWNPTPA